MKTTTAEKISQSLKKTTHSLLTKDERMGNYEEAGTFTSAFREDAKLQTCCSVTVHLKSRCLSSSQVLLVFGRKKKKMEPNSVLPTASWKNHFQIQRKICISIIASINMSDIISVRTYFFY